MIAVADSATYTEDLDVQIPAGDRLVLVAADWPATDPLMPAPGLDLLPQSARGLRPHLAGRIQVTGTGGPGCEFVLDGISAEGDLSVQPGDLGSLVLADSTLTAGRVTVTDNPHLAVRVLRGVLAGLTLPGVPSLSLADTLLYDPAQAVDAADARVDVQGCTLFGRLRARILTAGNSLFCGTRRRPSGTGRMRAVQLPGPPITHPAAVQVPAEGPRRVPRPRTSRRASRRTSRPARASASSRRAARPRSPRAPTTKARWAPITSSSNPCGWPT